MAWKVLSEPWWIKMKNLSSILYCSAFALFFGVTACASGPSSGSAKSPEQSEEGASEEEKSNQAMPEYLVLEILANDSVKLNGVAIDEMELQNQLENSSIRGLAIYAEANVPQTKVARLASLAKNLGKSPVRISDVPGAAPNVLVSGKLPVEMSQAVDRDEPPKNTTEEKAPPATVAATTALAVSEEKSAPAPKETKPADVPEDIAVDVELVHMGLHIGGGPNDDATRNPLLERIKGAFPAFKRCYPKAAQGPANASVGVDLLIPTKGGNATVKSYRSVLKGSEFESCMKESFGAIEFKEREKPTMISYSVLFKRAD